MHESVVELVIGRTHVVPYEHDDVGLVLHLRRHQRQRQQQTRCHVREVITHASLSVFLPRDKVIHNVLQPSICLGTTHSPCRFSCHMTMSYVTTRRFSLPTRLYLPGDITHGPCRFSCHKIRHDKTLQPADTSPSGWRHNP